MTHKNTICLWFDKDAEAAANFYAATFPTARSLLFTRHQQTTPAVSRATS